MRGKAVEVVLSEEESGFFEAHARNHKARRSLSDCSGIIHLCAEKTTPTWAMATLAVPAALRWRAGEASSGPSTVPFMRRGHPLT